MGNKKMISCEVKWGFGGDSPVAKVEIVPGESIRIAGSGTEKYGPLVDGKREIIKPDFDRTFKLGDEVEYGSYNLKYTGPIVAIGPKTVTVDCHGTGERKKRLSLRDFIWRNWDFDAAETAAYNANEMLYI